MKILNKIKALFNKNKVKAVAAPRPQLSQHPLIHSYLNAQLSRGERGELIKLIKEYGGKYSLTEISALIIKRRGGR